MSYKLTQAITPGTSYKLPLKYGLTTQAVDVWNGTPFDLDYRGFGVLDTVVQPAGVGMRYLRAGGNEGDIQLLGVNNNAISGTGVVNITVYDQGDIVPAGKFPAYIPVQVVQAKVSSVSQLINDGNAVGTSIIESTPLGASGSCWSYNNDGTGFIAVDIGGTPTKVIQTAAADPLLTLGASTHNTENLGNFKVDGTTTLTGNTTESGTLSVVGITSMDNGLIATDGAGRIVLPNNKAYSAKDTGGTAQHLVYVDLTNGTNLQAAALGGTIFLDDQDGTTIFSITKAGGIILPSGYLGVVSTGDVLNANGLDTYLASRGNSNVLHLRNATTDVMTFATGVATLAAGNKLQLIAGSLTRFTGFSGSGTGTFNTNLGTTPNQIAFNPCTVSGSSQTIGGTNAQSSVVTTGAGLAWGGMAFKDV